MAENNNVVAKLCSDGSVWPIDHTSGTIGELASLVNYKIRTEGDMVNKHKLNTTSVAVVDLGKQLLLYAKDSDLTGVRTMLARGAPFTSDWLGMSALHFAAMNNQYEICDVLIQGGMNKDIKTKVDRTPLHFATYYGNERIVKMLLTNKCAVNPKDMLRMTPLHWAIERRHKNIVRLLLKYNADVNVVTKFNKTPIGIAVLTEQPDILAELQVAKAEQAKKLFNEEQEKEISDAVGTILAEVSNQTDTKNHIDYMEIDDNTVEPQITNFERIQETGILDKNAINLLKSHGISMMQEEDEDGSKDLLSTALQNGRQLVLSEGGKMLLNETRQHKFIKHNSNTNTIINNAAVQQKNINNKQNITVPRQQQQQQDSIAKNNVRIVSYKEFQNMFYNSSDGKPVEKPTQTMSNMRIIRQQQNDVAINLSSSKIVGNAASVRNSMITTRSIHQSQQHRQMKITPMKATAATVTTTPATKSGIVVTTTGQSGQHIIKESNDLSDIIQILPNDNKNDIIEINHNKNVHSRLALPNPTTSTNTTTTNNNNNTTTTTTTSSTSNNVRSTINPNSSTNSNLNTKTNTTAEQTCTPNNANNSNVPVCFIQTRRGTTTTTTQPTSNSSSTVRQINLMKRPHQQSQHIQSQSQNQQSQTQQNKVPATTTNLKNNSGQTLKPTPNVMPLLSTPEICRQLYEMRKQNEELKRRVDMLQKEKDDMRQRIDRLEELLLVERADEEAYEIES